MAVRFLWILVWLNHLCILVRSSPSVVVIWAIFFRPWGRHHRACNERLGCQWVKQWVQLGTPIYMNQIPHNSARLQPGEWDLLLDLLELYCMHLVDASAVPLRSQPLGGTGE
jgi:hypothetical protein